MGIPFTYGGDPDAQPTDEVRIEVGDTDETDPLLSDKEIEYCLARASGIVVLAALRGVDLILAKTSRLTQESAGRASKSWNQIHDHYEKHRELLKERAAVEGGMDVPAGGLSEQERLFVEQDLDRVRPYFTRNTHSSTRLYDLDALRRTTFTGGP